MLLCLGLDTQFAMVETLMAALHDIPQAATPPPCTPYTPLHTLAHRHTRTPLTPLIPPPLTDHAAQGAALRAALPPHARVWRHLRHGAGRALARGE